MGSKDEHEPDAYVLSEGRRDRVVSHAEIAAWRHAHGLPADDAIVGVLARRVREGNPLANPGLWLVDEAEMSAFWRSEAEADEALPESLRVWLECERSEVWCGVLRVERRPEGRMLVLGFTEDAELHLAQARERSPRPELLIAERGELSLRAQCDLEERIFRDVERLSALGLEPLSFGGGSCGGDDQNGFGLSCARRMRVRRPESSRSATGARVHVEYLGPERMVATTVRWATYEAVSETELVMRHSTNSCYQRDCVEVAENERAVIITIVEREPLGRQTMALALREARVVLRDRLAARVVIDGACDVQRPRWSRHEWTGG